MPVAVGTSTPTEASADRDCAAWHLYVLRCSDGTLYAGITTDLERRLQEHNAGPRGARYTRARRPVALAVAWDMPDRSAASTAEAMFKRLSRRNKLGVIEGCSAPPWIQADGEAAE